MPFNKKGYAIPIKVYGISTYPKLSKYSKQINLCHADRQVMTVAILNCIIKFNISTRINENKFKLKTLKNKNFETKDKVNIKLKIKFFF